MEHSQEDLQVDGIKFHLLKVWMASIKDCNLCGWDRCPTLWLSSQHLKTLWKPSTNTSSPLPKIAMENQPNLWSPSSQVTGQVSSAPWSLTQLTPWYLSSTKETALNQLANKLEIFMEKLDLRDCGMVLEQELSWWVPSQVYNGGFMTPSR